MDTSTTPLQAGRLKHGRQRRSGRQQRIRNQLFDESNGPDETEIDDDEDRHLDDEFRPERVGGR